MAEEMILFYIGLSNLIHAGISLKTSLETLAGQIENKKLREAVGGLSRSVEAGQSFSEALSHEPRLFPNLFLNMVRAGEASGKLDMILARYAAYMEEQAELRQKIQGALFYPLILLAAGLGVTLVIVTFIIPQFAEIFLRTGITLPLPTLVLYRLGMGLKQFWVSMILFFLAGGFGLQYFSGTAWGRFQLDRLILKLPLFGHLARKAAISRFGRTFGMLLRAGVPILDSLEIVRGVVGNEVLGRVLERVREAVEKGERVSESLALSGEFPPDTVQLIAVGEETGHLDEMLSKIADIYDRAVGYAVKKLTLLLEPLLLTLMGCMVGFIMGSMLLPMFDMMKVLRTARPGF